MTRGVRIYCDLAHPKHGRPRLKDIKQRPDPERSLPVVQALPAGSESLGRLFGRLPAEILADIVSCLDGDKEALCSLALASFGCCKLARAVLFAHLYLDYSSGSVSLLNKIACDCGGKESQQSIRPYVRAITVHTHHAGVHDSLDCLSKAQYGVSVMEATPEQLDELDARGTSLYRETFWKPIFDMLAKRLLPNLQFLSWLDRIVPVDIPIMALATGSGARNVDVDCRTAIPLEWDARAAPPPDLHRLRMHVIGLLHCKAAWDASHKWHIALLKWCAPTLESLEWSPFYGGRLLETTRIVFPNLQRLVCSGGSMRPQNIWETTPHSTMLSSFLFPNLRVLDLGEITLAGVLSLLSIGPIPHLEAFSIRGIQSPEVAEQVTAFLSRQGAGLERLGIEMVSVSIMSSHILPLLASGLFSTLKSLRLWWSEGYTEDNGKLGFKYEPVLFGPDDLSKIASITTLEQLCIAAGDGACSYSTDVEIPYDTIRCHLASLVNLKKMAFLKDKNYQKPLWLPPAMDRTFMLRQEVVDMSDKRPELDDGEPKFPEHTQEFYYYLWRRGHRNIILDAADAYAKTFPVLEWVYCGMLELGISSDGPDKCGNRFAYVIQWPETNNWETEEPVRRTFGL